MTYYLEVKNRGDAQKLSRALWGWNVKLSIVPYCERNVPVWIDFVKYNEDGTIHIPLSYAPFNEREEKIRKGEIK